MTNKNHAANFMEFIKNYGLIILLSIFILPVLYRWYLDQKGKNAETESELQAVQTQLAIKNPSATFKKANDITPSLAVQQGAKSIAHNLGTAYIDVMSWFPYLSPYSWTENDKAVADTLVGLRANFHSMELLYYYCYTANRNLKDDLYKYLDKENLAYAQKWVKQL